MSTFFVNGPSSFAVRGRTYAMEEFDMPASRARRARRWPFAAVVLLLLALAAWQLGGAAWIHARAAVAQRLIASAWEDAKEDGARLTRYRVREVAVVDKPDKRLLDSADSPQLTLITCRPFDAIQPGTAQRYVVIADRA